ncbi:MAG: iron chelate uptake ABC transporter family permease subunit [Candidatus Aegiribacteria sp.]|nr:iron chelate uptake ABC transporter family permease subunit [Candidatus Aegiribacteria sp.]MBD3295676.1 iron chelate uptake ABC transporter family permease subunit [Candidatus Fermentibacteria bacterium]
MTDILGYAFMQKALAVSILGSIACGIIGTLVTVNRMSALAGSIAHASFGGLGLAYVAGFNPLIGATGFALLSALGVAAVSSRSRRRTDTAMAAIWAVGMATGLVLVKLSGTYAANLMSWLFGSLLAVSDSDILFAVILNAILILAIVLFYKEFLAISYDREFSRLQGVPVNFFRGLFLVLTALTAVLLMRVTGLIMVIALLALPSAIAEMYTRSLWRMMVMASVLAAVFSTGGLFLAWWLDLPPGAVIILIASAAFGLALLIEKLRSLKS